MKRFAAVILVALVGLVAAGQADAGRVPQGESMVGRMGAYRSPHGGTKRLPAVPRMVDRIGQFRRTHPMR